MLYIFGYVICEKLNMTSNSIVFTGVTNLGFRFEGGYTELNKNSEQIENTSEVSIELFDSIVEKIKQLITTGCDTPEQRVAYYEHLKHCKLMLYTFIDKIRLATDYTTVYDARYKLAQIARDLKITSDYRARILSVDEIVLAEKLVNEIITAWRDQHSFLTQEYFNMAINQLPEPKYKFSLLYSIISYPRGQTTELYAHVCDKLLELLQEYPYLIEYDAILNHPIACELAHQVSLTYVSSTNGFDEKNGRLERFTRCAIFFRKLIMNKSRLFIHIDEYGTTSLTNLFGSS